VPMGSSPPRWYRITRHEAESEKAQDKSTPLFPHGYLGLRHDAWGISEKMDLYIDIELRDGLLVATARGNLTFDETLRLFKQVFDTAKQNQVSKILVNGLSVEGELSTLERYNLGIELMAYLKQHQLNPRLAVVGKPPAVDGFGVRVGQNRGLTTEVFSSQQEALHWLNKWPS